MKCMQFEFIVSTFKSQLFIKVTIKMPARNKSAPLSRPLPPFGKYYSANNDLPGARPSVR